MSTDIFGTISRTSEKDPLSNKWGSRFLGYVDSTFCVCGTSSSQKGLKERNESERRVRKGK